MDWSQSRYLDYAYLSIEVHPAPPGATTSMQVTALSDLGHEIDRVDLLRSIPTKPQAPPKRPPSRVKHTRRTGSSLPDPPLRMTPASPEDVHRAPHRETMIKPEVAGGEECPY